MFQRFLLSYAYDITDPVGKPTAFQIVAVKEMMQLDQWFEWNFAANACSPNQTNPFIVLAVLRRSVYRVCGAHLRVMAPRQHS